MDIDLGSEDGIYFAMVGRTISGGDAFMARMDIAGNIEWQKSLQITSPDGSTLENSQFYNVFPFGDQIYAQGAILFDSGSEEFNYERGLVVRFSSSGTLELAKSISDGEGMSFRGIHVDGVNLILTGIKNDLDGVVINVDRDVTDLGTAVGYEILTETAVANTETLAVSLDSDVTVTNLSGSVTDDNLISTLATGIDRSVVGTREGFGSIGRGIQWTITDLDRRPKVGSVLQIAGDTQTYFLIDVLSYDQGVTGTAVINIDPGVPNSKAPDDDTVVTFREAYSQVRMTGHDFLDIGSGDFSTTAYPVLLKDDYAQRPNQAREIDESNGGRCFYTSTDQDGNFRVGAYFRVDQATGRATLSSEDFDLTGLNELQLGSVRAGRRGATINEFSTDGTMSDASDGAVPTERAVVTYVQSQITAAINQQTAFTVGLGW